MQQVLGIYIRVSTTKQAEKGLSADDQKERGIEKAKELGWDYKLYDDRGISASKISFKDRYLNELIIDSKAKVLSGIYCTDIDRWSRDSNYDEGQIIISLIKISGVQVFTPNGEFKLNDPTTELMVRIKSLFASFEAINRKGSVIRGLERSATLGHTKGGAYLQYGYKRGDNKMLVIDSEEVKWVKWIYRQAFDGKGKGCMVIARLLNEKGVPTKIMNTIKNEGRTGMIVRGKKQTEFKWRDKTVLGILKNPIYKGIRVMKGKEYEAPVIIEPEYWDAVQIKIQNRNQYKDTNNIYEYLLKGLIMCPICGRKIQGKKRANGKDNCYTCMSYREGPNCGNRGINIEYLNDLVCENIKSMDKLIEIALSDTKLQQKIKKHKTEILWQNQKIVELTKKKDKYLDAILDGTVSKEQIRSRLDSIDTELMIRHNNIRIEERGININEQKEALMKVARDGIKDFKVMKTFNDRAGFIATAIKQITVRWIEEYRAYDIVIQFRLNQLENYLISKQVVVNRDGRDAQQKTVNKVLSENVTLENLIQVDGESVLYSQPTVDFTDSAMRSKPPIKGRNGKIIW